MDSAACLTRVLSALQTLVPRPGSESVLAEDVRRALESAGIEHEVEAQLSTGRVDVLVGSVAVELKVKGTQLQVLAQLERYAQDPGVEQLLLVTTSAKLRAMPAEAGGKPLEVVYLMRL